MNSELVLLSTLGLHPCKPCPRIARVGAIAGAAYEGNPTDIKEIAIKTLTAYRRETPDILSPRPCLHRQSCSLPGKDVICFLRRERAKPLTSSVLTPA